MSIRPIFLVLSEHNGPVPNPQKDQSSVKSEIQSDPEGGVLPPGEFIYKSNKSRIPDEERGLSDGARFARKFYLESKEIAVALANDLAKKHPGRVYTVLETVLAVRSSVQEPESLPLADAA